MTYLLVFLGGGAGAALRHALNRLALAAWDPQWPLGTLIVNLGGSSALGFLVGLLAERQDGTARSMLLLLGTGFLGGFTTFSAFSLDAIGLWQRGDPALAFLYVVGSVVLAIGGAWLGLAAAKFI